MPVGSPADRQTSNMPSTLWLTDPVTEMEIRRMFAMEALVCFGIVTFHILWLLDRREG